MREITLEDALGRVRSSKTKDRNDGLNELINILKRNQRSQTFENLSDKAYHQLLETLFRVATVEVSAYIKASKASQKKSAESQLSKCAEILRRIVQVGTRKFRLNTVKSLLDHITQTLPTSDESYCEPLTADYLRSLKLILSYPPHPEHLSKDEWYEVVEFCVQATKDVSYILNDWDLNEPNEFSTVAPTRSRLSFRELSSVELDRHSHDVSYGGSLRSRNNVHLKGSAEDIVVSLQYLVSVPNSPILEKAQAILECLLELLRFVSLSDHVQYAAFQAINAILTRIRTDDTTLVLQVMQELIPLIRRCWLSTKSSILKEAMLVGVLFGEVYFPRVSSSTDGRAVLLGLVEVLQDEYCRRHARDQLQVDDLDLSTGSYPDARSMPFQTSCFRLRLGLLKAEPCWALLSVSAAITVETSNTVSSGTDEGDDYSGPRIKRRKMSPPLDTLMQGIRATAKAQRLYALQIFCFVFDMLSFDPLSLQEQVEGISSLLTDDDITLASWTMLAVTCAAMQDSASSPPLRPLWIRLWRATARSASISATCRSACHLLAVLLDRGLVRYAEVVDIVDGMISSMEISGPVDCIDSAIALNCSLLRDKSRENPSQTAETSEKIMSWLFRCWKPAAIRDRQHTTKASQHCPVYSIVQLISICLGGDYMDKVPSSSISLGLLGRTRLKCIQDEASIRYLLLTDARKWPTRTARHSPKQAVKIALSGQQAQSVIGNTLNILSAEVRTVLDEGLTTSLTATPSLGGDIIKVTTSLCIVAHAVLSSKGFQNTYKRDDLQKATDELTRRLITAIIEEDRRQILSAAFLEVFADFIPQVRNLPLERNMAVAGACSMLKAVGMNFWREILSFRNPDANTSEDGGEDNEDGEEFQPRGNHGAPDATQTEISHEEMTAATDQEAFRASLAAQLCWITSGQEGQLDSNSDFMPPAFIQFLTSLQPPKFLGCRGFLRVLFGSDLAIDAAGASTVLEYIGKTMLRPYVFERCEVALGSSLDVMKGLVEVWTNQGNGEAAELGGHIYEWFIEIALSKGICSTHVHICLSSLLQRVIKCNPDYAKNLSLPSARTSLFRVLQEGSLEVKFHVGNNISEIFGLFVLKEHESILEDVIQTLPKAADWIDGIASRLFILAHLASSWPTLLRRCIYAIFEAPRAIPESTGHARQCITQVATSLALKNPRELFKLFVSQIIYTWLETQSLGSIPYSVFGFDSLAQLLQDVQDEVVGQIVMRGREGEGTDLAQDFGKPFHQLVEESITKTAGYCIARDVAMPPSRNTHAPGAEARLRKLVGKEQYASLVAMRSCEILSVFFKSMDEEEKIERGFGGKPSYHNAHVSYQAVKAIAASGEALPLAQQPSFKARYIFDEIEHLCRRTNTDTSSVWTPSAYVYLFRELLDTIHPALGSLHACYVIRKLRVLISLAGPTALQDYPLEMALHSLRPFLTDTHCAEDTIGIVQYLLTAGSAHMREVPSFLAGMAIVSLTSMKAFLGSSQESTTQESQYKATMNNAYKFHSWFASYLNQYESHKLNEKFLVSFKNIVKAAWNAQANGNARRESYESDLLMEILDDQLSSRNLLNQPSKDLILRLQCGNFHLPTNFRDDILGSDSQAVKYSPVLWKICQRGIEGRQFMLWVSRVLGRAYAASGYLDRNMTLEVPIEVDEKESSAAETSADRSSRARILKLLCDVLLVDDRTQVSIVEKSLRSMISQAKKTALFSECESVIPPSMMEGLLWQQDHHPSLAFLTEKRTVESATKSKNVGSNPKWMQSLCVELTQTSSDDPILSELPPILTEIDGIAERLFPFVLHLSLIKDYTGSQEVRRLLSTLCQRLFVEVTDSTIPQIRLVLQSILYLRKQPLPHESTKADRTRWLQIDYKQAALAAVKCSMFKTALLFLDIHYSEAAKTSRRASDISIEAPTDLLLHIYQNIDEQDSFYGVQQPSSLSSMMSVLEYEHAGFKSLSFQGAHYDTQIRFSPESADADETGMIRALDSLDLNGLSQSLMRKLTQNNSNSFEYMLNTARKLEQWDVSAPVLAVGSSGSIFRAFQGISNAPHGKALHDAIDSSCAETFQSLMSRDIAGSSIHKVLSVLATLTELNEVFSSIDVEQFMQVWARFKHRESWMLNANFDHVESIMSCRETMLSILSKNNNLQSITKVSQRDARTVEMQSLLRSSEMSRRHAALQNSLTTVTYLNRLIKPCEDVGVKIGPTVQFESAKVLWDQGEMAASIRMLQDLRRNLNPNMPPDQIGRPELLAALGHQISEARLERPDEIINRYLVPAINELSDIAEGNQAGQVFHEFASFCDQQLQNPDGLEDYNRIQKLRETKEAEVQDLDRMIRAAGSQAKEKENLKSHRNKAKQWFDIDDRDFQRLRDSRQAFLRQSLENYLKCLRSCDKYDNDALRFSALWLQNHESEIANSAVKAHISDVGSRKFASLMNQWSSRLLEVTTAFQSLLSELVFRICVEHPYHGMYQLFASSKTKGGKDEAALARHRAANNIVSSLRAHNRVGRTWLAIHNTNIVFVRFAAEKLDESRFKPGSKVPLKQIQYGRRLEQDITAQGSETQKIPPPTMTIELRADCDYRSVPLIAKFQPEFTVASGISMPKIITAVATDGTKYKQLFKSGNDDLRQDSIMEQVFEQVSRLLRAQHATRQRNLGIRTYKVLPLTATSGIIEFVPNTIPLHDYLMPAHHRHFPRDIKPTNCRKAISDAQPKSVDVRIKAFRSVCNQFHPVLRYFFQERFENPDDWFDKRLAYTRSTASISILGHVLGLGDRHGHNILLDEKTGEVVHIDLGIAFEQGRVLPVPEVVPFRLTRDLVDGMGITGTEGVFRRCCEFTLEALRNESYSIMTILDVLRYDPLYSWSLSPLRLKKMQDAQSEAPSFQPNAEGGDEAGIRKQESEPGEADRALTVVNKKLSKSLSVTATVNELISTATDERNLALLFAGWAAYA